MSHPSPESEVSSLLRQYQPAMRRQALRSAGDAAEADDLVQDAFERALRAYARLKPQSNIKAWLDAILRRLICDRWRRGRRIRSVELEAVTLAADDCVGEPWWLALGKDEVREEVARLPPKLRAVAHGHLIEGRSYTEIARRERINVKTVGTRLHRARHQLRVRLSERGPTPT